VLATLGDLVDDIVVQLAGPINDATDTSSVISRRRGGSAANVAATAGVLGQPVRFLGQVGADAIGAVLVAELDTVGVDTRFVRKAGSTGTIVVLVAPDGERSMLADRGTCVELDNPQREWLDGITTLHVPLYSLIEGATATTASTLIGWAHDRRVAVSLDLSSTALMNDAGLDRVRALVSDLEPDIVFANQTEGDLFGLDRLPAEAIAVVKNGPDPALVRIPAVDAAAGTTLMIPAIGITDVSDTTGAGDAFAAGFLTFLEWRSDPGEACVHAHRAAQRILTGERR
jgi:sugar/nucleoside kinase (ribokinase family)